MPEHWPDTVVPILFQRRYFHFDVVKRTAAHAGQPVSNAVVNASIAQYPVVPVHAMTCHGVQGKTLSFVLLAKPRPAGMNVSTQAYYYTSICQGCTCHADVRNDDERLKSMYMSSVAICRLKAQGIYRVIHFAPSLV